MKQERLNAVARYIEKEDRVADIGCDHAYLSIYLVKMRICESVIASDIHPNALEIAKKNIEKAGLAIPTFLSDGVENLDQTKLNTLVLSGMGTSTILHILKNVDKNYIKKLVLQSNNDLPLLRKECQKLGYSLEEEQVVFEKSHYYVIGKYTLKKKKLNVREHYFGLYNKENNAYYGELKKEYQTILKKIRRKHILKRLNIRWKLYLLKKYL